MKILMNPVEYQKRVDYNLKINDANMICPFCKSNIYTKRLSYRENSSLFSKKIKRYYEYECIQCHGKWEGDPLIYYVEDYRV